MKTKEDIALQTYIQNHIDDEPELLQELQRQAHITLLHPRMLSGHLQGNVLSMLSKMIQPKNILEIGTYTGYSAICLAEGLQKGGKLHTIDINEELERMVKDFFKEAGMLDRIHFYNGNALNIIPTFDITFDIIFIDADKKNYAAYYDMVFDKVKSGGYIIADNVLWSGKILDAPEKMDSDTKSIDLFNKKVNEDDRVENILLPVRDGLMIARKK